MAFIFMDSTISYVIFFNFHSAIYIFSGLSKQLQFLTHHKLYIDAKRNIIKAWTKGSKCNRQKQQELDFSVIIPLQNI